MGEPVAKAVTVSIKDISELYGVQQHEAFTVNLVVIAYSI